MANTLTPLSYLQDQGAINLRCYNDARVLAANVAETITVPTFTDAASATKQASRLLISATVDTWILGLASTDGDIVTNGTFASDTAWTKGTGWTIAAGVADAAGAISVELSQVPTGLLANRYYLTTFTATRAAGTVAIEVGGTAGTARSSSATFTEVLLSGSDTDIAFVTAGFTGTVDTVSVVPVAAVPAGDITSGYAPILIPAGAGPREFYVGTTSTISIVAGATSVASLQWFRS